MSEKRGPPPTSAYGMTTPGVSYPQMMPQGAPPSYAESLTHPVVAGPPGMPPQYASPYISPAAAAASAAHLQNYKWDLTMEEKWHQVKTYEAYMQKYHGATIAANDQIFAQTGQWYLADPMFLQNIAAAQQAQKVALSQQAQQQHQAALYMQQQQQAQQQPQQMYLQQVPGYFQHPQAAAVAAASSSPFQPGQNVLVMNGFDSGARFDGISQPNIPPPPPGVAPNAAQLAAASGAHVSSTQKKGSFLSGGSGGDPCKYQSFHADTH
ncbi:uncharacterized protein LOC126996586 isoform X2 [Eriocheir sinensis]|uniref:uncharacterized protein LOC126996586 isoform X2 n=1 Tax=Eriocheir sinensis TaxID=95602 RepID=UPI0021C75298|nr:uncharacterized protein LOC126996586 isoform X2 [Eriocheir sinensis]